MARRPVLPRLAFRLGDAVAPGRAARVAGNLWFTPPRPRPGNVDEPAGGEPFTVEHGAATIRGMTWGDSGPRIYFMHGWGGRGADVAALVPPLLERGFRVITFDGPAHGGAGPRRTNAVEMGRALVAVVSHHGPAYAVVAHSLGGVAVALRLRAGDLACDRVVLLAPVIEARGQLAAFGRHLGIGERTRSRLDGEIRRHTGLALDEFTVLGVDARDVLVVHDRDDRLAPHAATAAHVRDRHSMVLVSTAGLGHHRLLKDRSVARTVAEHVAGRLGSSRR
jgi:pimeloyl-ACP methyl ester carboxylesterase